MKVINVLVVFCTLFFASVSFAGQTQPAPVDVDLDNRTASGDMLTARFDDGDDVFIGCGIRKFDFGGVSGEFQFGFCQAEDSEGERAFCTTESLHLLDAMQATSDYSFVTFSWDEDDICTRIGFSTQSFYLPSKKNKKKKK